jgi:Protein of unknown function (DUF3800)
MPTIFVDESGTFKACKDERYFVIASFTVGDPKRTAKRFEAWRKRKFPKKMRGLAEVKYSSNGISDDLRIRTIAYISTLDVRIRYAYLKCENVPMEYMKKGIIQSGLLYSQVLGEALEQYFPITEKSFFVICDQRRLKGVSNAQFKQTLTARILAEAPRGTTVRVDRVDSTADRNIQIVDWIVGAIAAYLNKKSLGEKCMEILKDNVIGSGKELFKKSDQ